MKREIKFRAWDVKNQRMVYNPYYFDVYHYSDENRVNQQTYRYYEDWRDLEDGRGYECELMQFIGLKDMNGKEMYESDICKIHFHHDKTSDVGVIEWMRDASFCIRGKSIYSPAFKSGGGFGDYPAVEVIGNIYEHSHLLENGK